ncbi:MAG TPA: ankyrin repeat domain-containing protein, partial [Pyrinomonadaceae bacterium]|nr:ankyrin repeat domain-containing protein [Pyrinomonadaceae bacterium]
MDPKDRTSPESDRLHAPAEGGAADLAAELLAKLVSPTSVDEKGRTALHIACELGQLETVQLLINHGASVAVRDHAGNTPLMYAATSGNSVLIELLLELGADIHARNRRGQDALVLASISDHADAARLLRERLLAMRGLAAKTAASAAGTHFSDIPDKKGVFIGGVTRGNGEQSRTEPTTEEKQALAEEMNRSIPLTTFSGWLKQVNVDDLNPMGLLALDYGFPHFLNFLDFTEDQAHNALTRRGHGVTEFVNPGRARRFAGDHTLPRGRYYTVCKDASGDDGDTLQGELWAYYRPEHAGDLAMLDSANKKMLLEIEESGVWKLPRLSTPYIGIIFSPSRAGAANPFGWLAGVDFPNALTVLLPVSVREERIEKVLDLRQPEAARWLA